MANRYWVGGAGTWDGSSSSYWSTSSGGSGGASIPTAADAVFLDSNSGSGLITVGPTISGSAVSCASLNCTGFTGTLDTIPAFFDSGLGFNVYGNVTLSSGGTYFVTPYGGSSGGSGFGVNMIGTGTLTSVGKTISGLTVGDGTTTTTTLGDNLSIQPNSTNGASGVFFLYGNCTFNANNFNVNTQDFIVYDTGSGVSTTVNMGSGTWRIWDNTFGWAIYPDLYDTITINPGTSTIQMGSTYSAYMPFTGGGYTYNNLTITGKVGVYDNNTFNTITTNYIAGVKGIQFGASSTQTVTNFNVGNGWALESSTSGTRFNLSKASGTVSVDYLSIQDSNATGGAAWYAGTHSTNVSNNLGWTFTAPPIVIGGGVTISGGVTIG